MAYVILILAAIGITYVLWAHQAQVKDFLASLKKGPQAPNLGAPVPNPGVEAKAPPAATVPGTSIPMNGVLEAYLRNGSGNVQPSTENLKPVDPKAKWRTDLLIDQPGYWKVSAGGAEYTVKAVPGSIVTFLVGPADEGMANGSLSARGMTQDVINGYGNITFQALDEATPLSVKVDKPVLLQRV